MLCFGCNGAALDKKKGQKEADNYAPNGYGSDPLAAPRKDRNYRPSNQYRSVVPLEVKKSPRSRSQPHPRMTTELQIQPGGVDFSRITDRIAAITFPTGGSDNAYRSSIKEVSEKLRKTYGEHYKIFNLSQKRSDLGRANSGAVIELGWPDQLAPPLDKLCSICKQFENWLNSNPKNLVVIHCKGWRSRAAIVIASYMHYANVCSSEESVADRFSMQLFSEKFLQFDGQPSHKRYVRYFANLISGATKVNPQPIHLTSITFTQFPVGRTVLLKIYERMKPVYNTEKIPISSSKTTISFGEEGLSLRGDFLVKCFAKPSEKSADSALDDRQLLFQCQFNTCALELDPRLPQLSFHSSDLDLVDPSIGPEANIEFNFIMEPSRSRSSSLKRQNSGQNIAQRPEQRAQSVGAEQNRHSGSFSRVDSYENFDRPEDDRSQSQSLNLTPQPSQVPVSPPTTKNISPIHIEAPQGGLKQQNSQNTDGADSGIGSDSPKNSKFEPPAPMPAPPAVPPKPRGYTPAEFEDDDANESTSRQEDDEDDDDENDDPYGNVDGTIGRERKVLPAALRTQSPDSENPRVSKHTSHGTTSKIDSDLVAKGRYDPNSKCFSYVPAKSLKEHYRAPKKPSSSARRASIEPAVIEVPDRVEPEQLKDIPLHGVELQRRAETPKWEDEINKLAGDLPTDSDFRRKAEEERRRNQRQQSLQADPFGDLLERNLNYEPPRLHTPRPHSPPQQKDLFEQKKRGNEGNLGGMDDLCDPEYYMTYSSNTTPTPDHASQRRSRSMAPAYEQTYTYERKPLRTISQRDFENLNDMIYSSSKLPPRPQQRSYTPKPTATYQSDNPHWPEQRDIYRQRNSRSVNALPTRKLSFQEPEKETEADEWLREKLSALKNKRLHDPDGHQRRQAEKLLLEQLKNTSVPRDTRPTRSQPQSQPHFPAADLELPQHQDLQQRAPILRNAPHERSEQLGAERQSRRDSYGYRAEPRAAPQPVHSILKQPQATPPTRDELRIANRQAMEKTTRSKTPSYQYDQDRASLVRQRSATPTILFPSGQGSSYGSIRPESRQRATPSRQVQDPMEEFGYSQHDFSYRQPTPSSESHYAPRSEYASRDHYSRGSNYGPIAPYQRDHNATPQHSEASDYRRPRGATPTSQIVRQKPPTPPPQRPRSRSPNENAISPIFGKKPQVVLDSERKYQERLEREANRARAAEGDYQKPKKAKAVPGRPFDNELKQRFKQTASDEDEPSSADFGYLNNMVNENRAKSNQTPQYATKSILKRSGSGSDSNYAYNNYGSVGSGNYNNYYGTSSADSMGSSAHSGFSAPEIYAAPYRYGDETPVAEPDYGSTLGRSDTPSFPTQSGNQTPLPYHPLLYQGASNQQYQSNGNGRSGSPRSMYYGANQSRRSSLSDNGEVITHHPVFMRDTSKYWYKPSISREEAINILKDKEPGTFVVRDSNSFPGAFGLALKVAQPPAGVERGDGTELVRHFLIEPSAKGVKLKGCNNEPVFGTLAALIYQHSITALALPQKLILPEYDPAQTPEHVNANQALLDRGAACNVTFICSLDTESLTGPEAVRRATNYGLELLARRQLCAVPVHFKVSAQGITLTDNTRTLFFRRHYPVNSVTFAGIDPDSRTFDNNNTQQLPTTYVRQAPVFGFVARKTPNSAENTCHIFAELDPEQPASAVVRFITNVMMVQARAQQAAISRTTNQ